MVTILRTLPLLIGVIRDSSKRHPTVLIAVLIVNVDYFFNRFVLINIAVTVLPFGTPNHLTANSRSAW